MEAKSIDADGIFKLFTTCPNDPRTLILDVRPHKEFKKKHINQAYCVRVSSNQQVLADYSQSSYSPPWSQHCWWGKPVVVYGPAGVGKDHPVVKFLTAEGRCTSVQYFKPGFDAFEKDYPFLCTPSVKANSIKKYPSMILPRFLYLGDWADAQQHERVKEIGIKRSDNHTPCHTFNFSSPQASKSNQQCDLEVLPGVRHLKIEMADVEGADISPHFNAVYEFLSEAERLKQPTLVHCGAGVSRSACLVMMYLMRSRLWSAQKSRDYCIAARSLVCPNDGFWRVLCALEGPLGILDRSDPEATMGFAGADAPAKLDTKAAGLPVTVKMITAAELKKQQQEEEAAKAAAAAAAARAAEEQQRRDSEAAAVAVAAAAAEDADHSLKQGGERMPKLQRGRSRSRNKSTSSSSSSGSDSSTSTSSTSSDGSSSSSSDTSSSDDSSSSSSSDEELQQRSRSRDIDRSKKRHRSSSRDRAAAAAAARQEHSAAAAAAGDSSKRRKTHSSSRSRSPERPKLRRGSGEGRDRRDGGDDSADTQRGSSPSNHRSSRAKFKSRSPLRRGGEDRRTSRSRSRQRDHRNWQQQQRGRSNSRDRDRRDRLAQVRDSDRKDRGSDRDRNRHREREGDRTRPDSSSRGEHRGDHAAANAANGHRAADDRAQQQFPAPPAAAAGNAAAGEPAAPAAAAAAAKGQSGWLVKLEVSKPEGLVGQLVLGPMNIHQRVVFGRAPSCNVVMEHLSVSRQHAQLSVDLAGTVNVMDMGAAHGTKLNDTWIKAQQPRAMPVGSQLRFGASTRVYTLVSVEKI